MFLLFISGTIRDVLKVSPSLPSSHMESLQYLLTAGMVNGSRWLIIILNYIYSNLDFLLVTWFALELGMGIRNVF